MNRSLRTLRFPCVYAHKNGTNQTGFNANTWTQVTFSTEVYDIGSYFATNAWTPPAGKIWITCAVGNAGTMVVGSLAQAAIYKNGSVFSSMAICSINGGGELLISCYDHANGSDAYTLWGYCPAGASRQFAGAIDLTYFTGHWFAP